MAIDIAPGMVERLGERLAPYPACIAEVMNGETLSFPDGAYDAAFSIFGVIFFRDWRGGQIEQHTVGDEVRLRSTALVAVGQHP
jgi:hypothetical protein